MNKSHCTHCPLAAGQLCLGSESPERFGHYCTLAETGTPLERQMIVGRSAIGVPVEPPGLLRRAASFAVASVRHVAAGRPIASPEQQAERLRICQGCELFDAEKRRCKKCGCGQLKLAWADQECPVGKWGPIAIDPAEPLAEPTQPVEPAPAEPANA